MQGWLCELCGKELYGKSDEQTGKLSRGLIIKE